MWSLVLRRRIRLRLSVDDVHLAWAVVPEVCGIPTVKTSSGSLEEGILSGWQS